MILARVGWAIRCIAPSSPSKCSDGGTRFPCRAAGDSWHRRLTCQGKLLAALDSRQAQHAIGAVGDRFLFCNRGSILSGGLVHLRSNTMMELKCDAAGRNACPQPLASDVEIFGVE